MPETKGVTRSAVLQQVIAEYHNNHRLYRFPAHEFISGASKIPTVIYYDRNGKVRGVGAEAMKEGMLETAKDENWAKAEW